MIIMHTTHLRSTGYICRALRIQLRSF